MSSQTSIVVEVTSDLANGASVAVSCDGRHPSANPSFLLPGLGRRTRQRTVKYTVGFRLCKGHPRLRACALRPREPRAWHPCWLHPLCRASGVSSGGPSHTWPPGPESTLSSPSLASVERLDEASSQPRRPVSQPLLTGFQALWCDEQGKALATALCAPAGARVASQASQDGPAPWTCRPKVSPSTPAAPPQRGHPCRQVGAGMLTDDVSDPAARCLAPS